MKKEKDIFTEAFINGYLSACKDVHNYADNQRDVIRTPELRIKVENAAVDYFKKIAEGEKNEKDKEKDGKKEN